MPPPLTPFGSLLRGRPTSVLIPTRQIHKSPALQFPNKNQKDGKSTKPSSSEYTQSGTDDQVVNNEDAAFNPDKTRPEQEKKTAGQGDSGNGNPLEFSPADHDVAKAGIGKEENKVKGGQQQRSGGSPPKKGKPI